MRTAVPTALPVRVDGPAAPRGSRPPGDVTVCLAARPPLHAGLATVLASGAAPLLTANTRVPAGRIVAPTSTLSINVLVLLAASGRMAALRVAMSSSARCKTWR
eukprot:4884103-Lingulodinium_polyedra.AAC.1